MITGQSTRQLPAPWQKWGNDTELADLLLPVGNAKVNMAQAVVEVVETKVTMADWTENG